MKRLSFVVAAALAASSVHLYAQQPAKTAPKKSEPAAGRDAAISAVRESASEFERAFNAGDARAVAALWTADGEYIDAEGRRWEGREALAEQYADFFKNNPNAKMSIAVESIRMLSDDAAIETGEAALADAGGEPASTGRYTAVHVKRDGRWLMASVRDERSDQAPRHPHLDDLAWLVGSWTAENRGVSLQTTFRWFADRRFIEQTFTARKGGRVMSSGKQIIGWDPSAGQVSSWTFTSDGGHAVGRWTPEASGWRVETVGVLADQTQTTAVNVLTKLDDGAMAWQSVQRTAGAFRVLDTEEVVLKREQPVAVHAKK